MAKYSLTKALIGAQWLEAGIISNTDGSYSRAISFEPLESSALEEGFEGPNSEHFFAKLNDLLTRLPSGFDGQILLLRSENEEALQTKIFAFEKVGKREAYSHFNALLSEIGASTLPLAEEDWRLLLSGFFGDSIRMGNVPDLVWKRDSVDAGDHNTRVLSLTELPQITWKACLQPVFEHPGPILVSLKLNIPNREKVRRNLETKRRVSHAMAITSSLEVRNIESNSVLSSSEETLERILVGKETLFEINFGIVVHGDAKENAALASELERVVAGIGNAGIYSEGIGCLPILKSHIPGNKTLGMRKLPILSGNLGHVFPLLMDYSRLNDESKISLKSRCGERSNLNLFSKENLNFNSFICGASGSGKSFLMNAILTGALADEPRLRLCIFDIGGSYKRIVSKNGGSCRALTIDEAKALIATFLKSFPIRPEGFFRSFLEILCGSGPHITHSHKVAMDELLGEVSGQYLNLGQLIDLALSKEERFFLDLAHWLKPHKSFDGIEARADLLGLIHAPFTAFDFKELEGDPVLQRAAILMLSELLWKDLLGERYPRTLVVFDEVWRFFAQSRDFLEEMYRTLRKYRAGIVSITQNLADYGDDSFAKMLFTNSFTKIFLQNGAGAEFLRTKFDLPESDVARAISVVSKKPEYSEFFALTPRMSQVFRLYPTQEFYDLANTENIAQQN